TYNASTSSAVLFGGSVSGGGYLGDTWAWNGSTWAQLTPSTSPPARFAASMAYDTAIGKAILFGGGYVNHGNSAYYNDTWTWDGTTWAKLRLQTSPSPRREAMMTYDPVRNVVVLFGGYGNVLNNGS